MGLIANQGSALVAPQATGLIDPRTGKPVGSDDPFSWKLIMSLLTKGFLSQRRTMSSIGRERAR